MPTSAAVMLGFGRSTGDPADRALIVLLADSNPANRVRAQARLEAAGHRCVVAVSWPDALAQLARTPVDAVLLDLRCQGARGFDAVRELRARPAPIGDLAILALSIGRAAGEAAAARESGCDALLTHPLDDGVLEGAVRSAVVARTPPNPLDAARRSALRDQLGTVGLRERDRAAMTVAGNHLSTLREAPASGSVREAAYAVAFACEGVGAAVAAAAAHALAAEPERRPVLLPALFGALMRAQVALRRPDA